jgi:uncharacterized protein YqjF (DUF2071 family)
MAGRHPEERVSRPVLCQRWQTMTFLHWAYDPAAVQAVLPAGLTPDTFDGAAWVGLTPFLLADFRPLCLPPVPRLSTFPETNVRTYVRDADGTDGLWFLSLDVTQLPVALGARVFYWVPYHWAAMEVSEGPPARYAGRRRGPRGPDAGYRIAVRPTLALADEDTAGLVDFLTGRWRAFTRIATRLTAVPVEHQPWPLWDAEIEDLEEDLLVAAGLPPPEGEPLAHFSPGVDVRLGAPRLG